MATVDSITANSKVISGCFGMPRISMPKDVEEITENSRHCLYFEIETHKGAIKASSYSGTYWACLGTADALEAVGLLRPEWCPGLPGNGKTRQAVVFDADGARLVFKATYRKTKGLSYIVIQRASRNKFYVELQATKEQQEWIAPALERRTQRNAAKQQEKEQIEKRKAKEDEYKKFHHSPSLFKDDATKFLKRMFNHTAEILSGRDEFSEHGETTIWVDEQSMQDVLSAGARLFEAIRAAKVVCRRKESHLSIVR